MYYSIVDKYAARCVTVWQIHMQNIQLDAYYSIIDIYAKYADWCVLQYDKLCKISITI